MFLSTSCLFLNIALTNQFKKELEACREPGFIGGRGGLEAGPWEAPGPREGPLHRMHRRTGLQSIQKGRSQHPTAPDGQGLKKVPLDNSEFTSHCCHTAEERQGTKRALKSQQKPAHCLTQLSPLPALISCIFWNLPSFFLKM